VCTGDRSCPPKVATSPISAHRFTDRKKGTPKSAAGAASEKQTPPGHARSRKPAFKPRKLRGGSTCARRMGGKRGPQTRGQRTGRPAEGVRGAQIYCLSGYGLQRLATRGRCGKDMRLQPSKRRRAPKRRASNGSALRGNATETRGGRTALNNPPLPPRLRARCPKKNGIRRAHDPGRRGRGPAKNKKARLMHSRKLAALIQRRRRAGTTRDRSHVTAF